MHEISRLEVLALVIYISLVFQRICERNVSRHLTTINAIYSWIRRRQVLKFLVRISWVNWVNWVILFRGQDFTNWVLVLNSEWFFMLFITKTNFTLN